jgi:hypothetical protein
MTARPLTDISPKCTAVSITQPEKIILMNIFFFFFLLLLKPFSISISIFKNFKNYKIYVIKCFFL